MATTSASAGSLGIFQSASVCRSPLEATVTEPQLFDHLSSMETQSGLNAPVDFDAASSVLSSSLSPSLLSAAASPCSLSGASLFGEATLLVPPGGQLMNMSSDEPELCRKQTLAGLPSLLDDSTSSAASITCLATHGDRLAGRPSLQLLAASEELAGVETSCDFAGHNSRFAHTLPSTRPTLVLPPGDASDLSGDVEMEEAMLIDRLANELPLRCDFSPELQFFDPQDPGCPSSHSLPDLADITSLTSSPRLSDTSDCLESVGDAPLPDQSAQLPPASLAVSLLPAATVTSVSDLKMTFDAQFDDAMNVIQASDQCQQHRPERKHYHRGLPSPPRTLAARLRGPSNGQPSHLVGSLALRGGLCVDSLVPHQPSVISPRSALNSISVDDMLHHETDLSGCAPVAMVTDELVCRYTSLKSGTVRLDEEADREEPDVQEEREDAFDRTTAPLTKEALDDEAIDMQEIIHSSADPKVMPLFEVCHSLGPCGRLFSTTPGLRRSLRERSHQAVLLSSDLASISKSSLFTI
ncbi:unnamed protein product [Protopolystoma xenopodis]|uniref:Uncharacterized protein n=1 Tax=Protopolystoma xenopodis TaxID=117903 RepID=A0A3S5CH62_9PLAT|nr:unnamed protein product [Protopolystoma xenopodis]